MHHQTAVDDLGLGTDAGTHAVVGIIIAHAKGGAMFLQDAVEQRVEDKLRVFLVVAYLTAKAQILLTLRQTEVDGIQTDIADHQRMDVAIAVDAANGRELHIEQQVFEIDVLTGLQHGSDGVVLLALDMQLHVGQQTAQGWLVNGLSLQLGHRGVGQNGQLAQQPLVVAASVELYNEVAALSTQQGRIAVGPRMNANKLGTLCLYGIADGDVADESGERVRQLQVGIDVKAATETDGERLGHHLHPEEVDMVDIGRHIGNEPLGIHQRIHRDMTLDKGIVAQHIQQGVTLVEVCRSVDMIQIPGAITQVVDAGVGLQGGARRQEVGALSLGVDISAKGIDRVARHEVMQVQVADADIGTIAQGTAVE